MNSKYSYKGKLVRVIDGDTLVARLKIPFDLEFTTTLRFLDVNAPETRGPEKEMGLVVENKLVELLELYNNDIFVETFKTGKFGRYLAYIHVFEDGQGFKGSVNEKVKQWSDEIRQEVSRED